VCSFFFYYVWFLHVVCRFFLFCISFSRLIFVHNRVSFYRAASRGDASRTGSFVVIFSLLLRLRGVDPVRQAGVMAGLRARYRLGVEAAEGCRPLARALSRFYVVVSRAVFSGRGIVACRRVGPALFIRFARVGPALFINLPRRTGAIL
jgi:hypothetical protein